MDKRFVMTKRLFALLTGMLCLTACSTPEISARTFYTSRRDLASYVVDTPDPEKTTIGLGQVIWVRWVCPETDSETAIDAIIRFKDGSEKNIVSPVDTRYGWLMLEIPSDERKEKGDILSYKILLKRGSETLASTQHKLWVEPIKITEG
jgi:hypothetical protein